nr:NIPSNAP family protein [Micromonospora sp. DSM 115978]
MATATQIRTYLVRPERLGEWVDRWRTLVVPMRRRFGFEVHGSWVDRERGEHIRVISYDGAGSFEEANACYWASAEREAMGLDPSQLLIGEQVHQVETAL